MTTEERVLAWLGQWRDALPSEAVASLQDVVRPPPANGVATAEEWEEMGAIARLREEFDAHREATFRETCEAAAAAAHACDPPKQPVHVHDRDGPLVPVNGAYRFSCTCGALHE